jgi:hypothetical protein
MGDHVGCGYGSETEILISTLYWKILIMSIIYSKFRVLFCNKNKKSLGLRKVHNLHKKQQPHLLVAIHPSNVNAIYNCWHSPT